MSASGPTDRKSWLPGPLSDPEGTRQWAAVYATTALDAFRPRERATFRDVERFCFFIGYSRSGHTLVGTMLNAHPEVVIAHELDAVTFVRHGFRRAQLFPLLVQRDQRFGTQGRTWSGYQYEIPGQFQGRYDTLRVLGDKRARSSVLQIAKQPALLDRLRRVVGVPIRVLHVTRNPFDNIATEARRHSMTLTQGTAWYQRICQAVATVRPLLDPSELLDVRYEDFFADPGPSLAAVCEFLGIAPSPAYLEACAGIVWPSANRSRETVDWTTDERRGVERLIESHEVLQGYTFGG
jgi:hypothetical protein